MAEYPAIKQTAKKFYYFAVVMQLLACLGFISSLILIITIIGILVPASFVLFIFYNSKYIQSIRRNQRVAEKVSVGYRVSTIFCGVFSILGLEFLNVFPGSDGPNQPGNPHETFFVYATFLGPVAITAATIFVLHKWNKRFS